MPDDVFLLLITALEKTHPRVLKDVIAEVLHGNLDEDSHVDEPAPRSTEHLDLQRRHDIG